MNGNGYETFLEDDDLELEALDDFDLDEDLDEIFEDDDDDFAERRRRRVRRRRPRWRTPRRARGRGYYRRRTTSRYVTQPQLKSALAKVQKDVRTNAAAIKKVNSRVNTVNSEQSRQATALKKEIAERKKETKKLNDSAQMSSLFSLLTTKTLGTTTSEAEIGGLTIPAGTKLAGAPDPMMALLPALMSGSDGNNNMLPLALILASD